MITLLLVTLPVEVIFLSVLHGLGWLQLPLIFAVFSVLFFCCAVREFGLSKGTCADPILGVTWIGYHVVIPCSLPNEFLVEKKVRPGYVCITHSLCFDGSRGPAALGRVL